MYTCIRKFSLFYLFWIFTGQTLLYANSSENDGKIDLSEQVGKTITGIVKSSQGELLPGATVIIKGTTLGTTTNFKGQFLLKNVPDNSTLVFSFIGMKTMEVIIGNDDECDIVLEPDAIGLQEVVAVGYGTQKKINLTGAVQTQSFDEAVNAPVTNSAQLMYGRFSGVQLTQNSGLPGSDASSVTIRGVNTFGSSNPLVVIDGMQFDGLKEFNQLAPSDIESVTVLKDASAGAIYGARGANGVIIVTTKKGKAGNFKVEVNSYIGFQRPTVVPELLNGVEYAEFINDLLVNNSGGNPDAKRYTEADIEKIRNGSDLDRYSSTDWVDETLKDASIQNNYLSFSGGTQNTQYRVSLGYLTQDAVVKGKFKYDRYNFLANISSKLNSWISINNNFSGSLQKSKGPTGGNGAANQILDRISAPPTVPVKYKNGYYGYVDGSYYGSTPMNAQPNGVKIGELGDYECEDYSFKERLNLILKPIKGLTFETALSISLNFKDQSDFTPYNEYRDWDGNILKVNGYNKLTNRFDKSYRVLNDNLLKFEKQFGDENDFSIMVGHSVMYDNYDWFEGTLENFPSQNLHEFNAGGVSNPAVAGSMSEVSLQSFFSRINYVHKNKYLFEMNVRRDGSSKFGPGKRYGTFPSFSLGWRITEESFMKDIVAGNMVDHIKLRGSWGRTGNDRIGNYIYDETYNSGLDYVLGGGTIVTGVAKTSLSNPTILWETTEQTDIGIDANFFSGKIFVVGDYFRRRSFDVLYNNFPVPSTMGVSSIAAQNSAEVLNSGIELNIGHSHHGELSYDISLNFSKMAPNEVVSLGNGVPTIANNTIIEKGSPFKAFYGYEQIGIFQTQEEVDNSPKQFGEELLPGDLIYKDISGPDGTPDGIVDSFDRTVIGDPYPEWMYGLNASMSYKGFDLGLTFQGIQNVDRIVKSNIVVGGGNETQNTGKQWVNRWTEENQSTTLYRLGGSKNNYQKLSTYWVQDASFLRLKNIELGYSLPERFTKNIYMQKFRFYASAQNLLTFTKMKYFDPERNASNQGTENVPIYKNLTLGVNVVF